LIEFGQGRSAFTSKAKQIGGSRLTQHNQIDLSLQQGQLFPLGFQDRTGANDLDLSMAHTRSAALLLQTH